MQENVKNINSLSHQLGENLPAGMTTATDLKAYLLEGVSDMLNQLNLTERKLYLEDHPQDSGNGFSPNREVMLGTSPINVSIPRTRNGEFYPTSLKKYDRVIPGDYESILMNILLNAKNFSAVKRSVRALNLPFRPEQLDILINDLFDEAKAFFSRRISPDYFVIYIDAKCIDMINEHKKIEKAVIFTVVGVCTNCKKEILAVELFWGNECIDFWKKVLTKLKNRGLTRVLSIVTDDFSGLLPVMKSFFPDSEHQLCHVHLLRNARRHLTKDDYQTFKLTFEDICSATDFTDARSRFSELVHSLKPDYHAYAKHLNKRADQYCAFAHFPRQLRPHIKSTNAVEGINNNIEIIRRSAGGLFHSERELFVKLKIMADSLLTGKWRVPAPKIKAHIHDLHRLFFLKFEADS